jgi:tetratricopeptide (TPR) repeat protein
LSPRAAGWSSAQQRAYATKLLSEGLHDKAVEQFDVYLNSGGIGSQEVAAVVYTIGKIRFDQARYDDALAAFYQVELADAASPMREQAARYVVTCLERLGRGIDARNALDRQTALHPSAVNSNTRASVVARIGDEEITTGNLRDLLQTLPPDEQEQFASPAAQRTLLRQYVTQRLLALKARTLGLDAATDVRRRVAQFEDSVLVRHFLDQELAKEISVSPADVKLYYEAHPELFTTPGNTRVTTIIYPTRTAAQAALDTILAAPTAQVAFALCADRMSSNVFDVTVAADGTAGVWGVEPTLATAVQQHAPGVVTNVVHVKNGNAIVLVRAHEQGIVAPFDSVQPHAQELYRQYKREMLLDTVLDDLQRAYRVQFYDDRLNHSGMMNNHAASMQ